MNINSYRNNWIKWKRRYEIRAYRAVNTALKATLEKLPISSITYENANATITLNITDNYIRQAYFYIYRTIGLTHGRRVGYGINREAKRFENDLFSEEFLRDVVAWVNQNGGARISGVTETLRQHIRQIIAESFEAGLNVDQLRAELNRRVKDGSLSNRQAETIAITETTTATSYAATKAGEASGLLLEKVWISTQDQRTRTPSRKHAEWNHVIMNGQTTDQEGTFLMTSIKGVINNMRYPGDPSGSKGNVIRCRCTVAFKPMRDADGFVITR